MCPRLSSTISDHRPCGGHSIATVRRQHHVVLAWINGRGAPHIHHVGPFLGLLGPTVVGIELSSKELDWVSAVLGTPVTLLPIRYLGLPLAEGRLRLRLAASNGEDRGPPWGIASTASFPWWSCGAVVIRIGDHPHIFYGHFPDAGRSVALDREHHATFLLSRDATIGDLGVGRGRMEDSLLPKISRWTRDPTP